MTRVVYVHDTVLSIARRASKASSKLARRKIGCGWLMRQRGWSLWKRPLVPVLTTTASARASQGRNLTHSGGSRELALNHPGSSMCVNPGSRLTAYSESLVLLRPEGGRRR